jgi:adenosylmethionine-8-amino-7-oxononanoate aminotransferase
MELTSATLGQHWLSYTANRDFELEPRLFARERHVLRLPSRSWTAHAAACAAGLATLQICEAEDLLASGRELAPYFQDAIFCAAGYGGGGGCPRLWSACGH